MNKKLLVIILVGVMALAVVNAGILAWYGQAIATIDVEQPISVTGDLEKTFNAMAGETINGGSIVITNIADESKVVMIEEDSPDGIDTNYRYCWTNTLETPNSIWICMETFSLPAGNTIIVPAEGRVRVYMTYNLNDLLESGTYTVTTSVEPALFIPLE